MKRRGFLTAAGLGAAGSVLAAPAIAQSMPEIRWRMPSSFPKSLETIYDTAENVSRRVAEATDNRFQIRVFAPGEIVPGLQVMDSVQAGTVEAGHSSSYYYVGKDPTFAFDTAMSFGLNTRQHMAWMSAGGGRAQLRELFESYNIHAIPLGHTGAQMGGWFRKEIKTPADLKGLKMRIGGFAGQVIAKLGVVPQQIAGGDLYPSLERGTIDAAEWVGPHDDEKLGLHKVAKFYYYPGWWEGAAQITGMFNLAEWRKLPKSYQAILEAACAAATTDMLGLYDTLNPAALRVLVGRGTQLRTFPREVMEACYKAAQELYAETSAKNARFKTVYESWKAFQNEQNMWFRVAENTYDQFMYAKSAQRKS